ncbi:MAG: 8-oxo-dGTP diphosphatase [Roseburia sp.]|nr:8-oxo-dGTP diphosphatase [Roseburia sp.]
MDRAQKVILTGMCQVSNGDEILVQYKISPNYSGVTFPGGHIEENETITDAVVREVFEETGLHIKNPIMRGIYDWINDDGTRYFVFLYSANEFFGELRSSEEGEVKWIKKDSFLHEKLAQGMATVFEIINSECISECFYNRATQEEIIK